MVRMRDILGLVLSRGNGATTFSITALRITTLSLMIFSIGALKVTVKNKHDETLNNDIVILMLNVIYAMSLC